MAFRRNGDVLIEISMTILPGIKWSLNSGLPEAVALIRTS
jgi:hypothetical protein